MPPPKSVDEGNPYELRPNAPISVVRAAKASLKEPTRPVTPADYGRQLFTTGDPSNRPSTSYSASGSKSFYPDGAPKLALPKLDPGRPDTASSSTLRKQGSSGEREASRLSNGLPGLEATMAPATSRGRQTTAEAVATLKANMGSGGADFSFARPTGTGSSSLPHSRGSTSDGPLPPDSAGRVSTASSSATATPASSAFHSSSTPTPTGTAGSSASSSHPGQQPQQHPGNGGGPSQAHLLGAEFSYGVYIEGGEGPLLDPRRNDDLPPRPGTSRGRPGSAALSDMDPITERYPGPPPGVQDMGNGAQVLDMAAFAQYSDDEENDFGTGAQQQQQQQGKQAEAQQQQGDGRQGGTAAGPGPGRPPPPAAAAVEAAAAPAAAAAAAAVNGRSAAAAAAGSSDLEGDPEFVAWRSSVEGVLAELSAAISGKAGSSALCGAAGRLVGLVEEARRREHSSRWLNSPSGAFRDAGGTALSLREAISEHAFRLMDSSNSELLMKACAIVLRVVKSRQPLLQTAKLLYRLSKDGSNDGLFRREGLLEPLVHTVHIMVASVRGSHNPANMHEPLVYMNGCLKNISNEAHNQKALVKLGTLHVLAALLTQMADQARSGDEGLTESCGQVAVQVSGVLRNLAVPSHNASAFLAAGVLPALRAACSALSGQVEVVLNAGRILSKLSLHEGCQAAIGADTAYAPLLVQLLGQYADNRAILLRVAFVLGNLTTTSNEYREQVCNVPFALVTVVGILQRYAFGGPGAEGGSGGSAATDRLSRAASHEDCLVKVLRLTANLAIWPDAGHALAEEAHVAGALLHLLEVHSFEAAEELVLNTVCALTNLSYYQSDTQPEGFTNKVLALPPSRLMPRITPLLMCDNEEAVIEAARVYGNFSRSPEVRDYMQAARVVEALVLLLDHSNSEVLYSVCGTLINFTMDASRKAVLGSLGGCSRLVEVLGRTVAQGELGERDEAIVDVVCKALFNVASAEDGGGAAAGGGGEAAAGAQGGGVGSSFTHEEVCEVLSLVEALEGSAVGEVEEMASVLGRLAVQMRRLQARISSAELEALPE
ncbi:hypothetical protein PLESTB_001238300 [Pleodorina starrii]|uniref:Uncharacterized protein n=1 Tax=Pleodorina starrii TaxID=330485 RepID=A0A9W6F6F1_9CHLO|nr:hypothetical protein PLESTM_000221500 [Pleodorina starrii]GLC57540.1 hypothetical protein PLESTB_001238300 [Pleodorina starrii]